MQDIQTQSIAIGDGLDAAKSPPATVLTQMGRRLQQFDFRVQNLALRPTGTYSVVTVCLAEVDGSSGAAVLFQSKDGFDWRFVTVLETLQNNQHGKMWECPDFFPLDGKQVWMLGPMEMLPRAGVPQWSQRDCLHRQLRRIATHTFTLEKTKMMDVLDFTTPPDHPLPRMATPHRVTTWLQDLVGHRG